MTDKILVITGASSGIGHAATELFASRGWQVYAGARRVNKIPRDDGITALPLDVTEDSSRRDFIRRVARATDGRIDVLINNAGYTAWGTAEEVPMAEVRRQFETNFFGAVALSQLVLPAMRARGQGRIVNVSSMSAVIPLALLSYYEATKAAMQQWSDAMDLELAPLGIRATCVLPNYVTTDEPSELSQALDELSRATAYQALTASMAQFYARYWQHGVTTAAFAKVYWQAATDKQPRQRYFQTPLDQLSARIARVHPRLLQLILEKMTKNKKVLG